jgi:hypothetical protein
VLALLLAVACGEGGEPAPGPVGTPISRTEGTAIAGAADWVWIPFQDAFCTDAIADERGRYHFGSSTTGLAISWGSIASRDVVIFLQGGGACWESFTCGGAAPLVPKTASTGPFGPSEFAQDIYKQYPNSWIRRGNLPASLTDATIVFVPYCTGDVHGGDRVTTYPSLVPDYPPVTWHHVGHANVKAFLRRLAPTFPDPGKLVIAGASAGGFGSLANYTTFRAQWPNAKGYLVDDSGPPLIGDAIPSFSLAAWYENWNLGASLDTFCPNCRTDMSAGLREIARRYPSDRLALVSHLEDEVIRGFFGTVDFSELSFTPMPADEFEAELRKLGTTVMDPATANAKYFFTAGDGHPTLEDPSAITSPEPGLPDWLELMLSDSTSWTSLSDP